MTKKATNFFITALILVAIAASTAACTVGSATPGPNSQNGTPVAQGGTQLNTPQVTAVAATPQTTSTMFGSRNNTLGIAEPLPNATISDQVTVRGSGEAGDNTVTVEVVAGDVTLGKSVVNITGNAGETGTFVTTVAIAPVKTDTEGLVTIYTRSTSDNSIDQRASVPVRLLAHGNTGATKVRGNQPNIRISPSRGRSGTEVTVVGGGFPAGSQVQIRLGGQNSGTGSEVYAETEAGQHGNIQASFIMPDKWPNGEAITLDKVVIVASTPDFVNKATAQYSLDTGPTPTVRGSALKP
jgi:hypothetical protein